MKWPKEETTLTLLVVFVFILYSLVGAVLFVASVWGAIHLLRALHWL